MRMHTPDGEIAHAEIQLGDEMERHAAEAIAGG
jgi:hypothetical protein